MALTQTTSGGVKDDAITLAHFAAGTDGQIITYDASGNPVAVGPGTDGQVLTSTGAGSPPAFESISIPAGTTINNNADNRLITGSGTANTLEAESGITFSGTELKIGGDTGVAGTWGLEIYQSDTTNNLGTALLAGNAGAELQLRDTVSGETIKIAANGQASFYSQKENDPMVFFTKPTGGSDTERLRLNGNGEIGLLTSTPNLTGFSSPTVSIGKSANPYSVLEMQGNNTSDGAFGVIAGYNSAGSARTTQFVMAKQGANNSGAFIFETASAGSLGERVRITNDGLTFGGDTATANALDDYEEGNWTVALDTGSNTSSLGYYVKIGKMVHIRGEITCDNTSSSNLVSVSGLPFQPLASSPGGATFEGSLRGYGAGDVSTNRFATNCTTDSGNKVYFGTMAAQGQGWEMIQHNDLHTNNALRFTVTYQVA